MDRQLPGKETLYIALKTGAKELRILTLIAGVKDRATMKTLIFPGLATPGYFFSKVPFGEISNLVSKKVLLRDQMPLYPGVDEQEKNWPNIKKNWMSNTRFEIPKRVIVIHILSKPA